MENFSFENFETLHVCKKHANEFAGLFQQNLQKMRKKRYPTSRSKEYVIVYKCGFPAVTGYPGHPEALPVEATEFLSKGDSISVWRRRRELVSVGLRKLS